MHSVIGKHGDSFQTHSRKTWTWWSALLTINSASPIVGCNVQKEDKPHKLQTFFGNRRQELDRMDPELKGRD